MKKRKYESAAMCLILCFAFICTGGVCSGGGGGNSSSPGNPVTQTQTYVAPVVAQQTSAVTAVVTCTTPNNNDSNTGGGTLCQVQTQTPVVDVNPVSAPAPVATHDPSEAAGYYAPISSLAGNWASQLSNGQYANMFSGDSNNPQLNLLIPGYSYFQGALYSGGRVDVVGPVRVIGGVCVSGSTDVNKECHLQDGAMITTDSEYTGNNSIHPKTKLHVVKWEEISR